jgi:hypothetical protein
LVGNSSTATCNHLEAFDLINSSLKIESNRNVVVPLSYGDLHYRQQVIRRGQMLLGQQFTPLLDFMPMDEYIKILLSCEYVIMNHIRQQGLGNIVIMLYFGARVFIRKENPIYPFLKEMGIEISTVQELESTPQLLTTPLSENQKQKNKELVSEYWSNHKAISRTKTLIEQALYSKSVKSKL